MAGLLDFLSGLGINPGPVATQNGEVTGPVNPGGILGQFQQRLRDASPELMGFGMGMLSGGNQQEGFANALQGMNTASRTAMLQRQQDMARQQQAQRQAAAAEYAKRFPQYAGMLAANPELADKFAAAQFNKQLNPDDPLDQKLKLARIEALQREAAGGNEKLGLNVIYGQNAAGETVPMQVGDRGSLKPLALPEGVKVANGVEKVDLGTSWGIIDKRTGQMIGQQPKDIAGKEVQEVTGKAQGAAAVALPDAMATSDRMLQQIDEVKNHPGKRMGTGFTSLANGIPSTDAFDFQQRVNQLKGGTFLQSYNTLRGAGAITDIEGQKAEQAIARLNTGLKGKDFDQALDDLTGVIKAGQQRMRQKAKGDFSAPAAPPAAKAGKTSSGLSWGVVD